MAGFNAALSENRMSKDEHDMMMLSLEKENAEARLQIEREFYEDARSMALTDAETKEDIVRKSGQRVIDVEKAANDKRAAMQAKMTTLVRDFKEIFMTEEALSTILCKCKRDSVISSLISEFCFQT